MAITNRRRVRLNVNRRQRRKPGPSRRFGGSVYTRRRVRISRGQTRQQFRRQTRTRLRGIRNPVRRQAYRQRRRTLYRRTH